MDLDSLLHHYFGAADPSQADAQTMAAASQRMRIDLGTEADPGRRFALWALLDMIGDAPDPERVFKTAAERDAARRLSQVMGQGSEGED